MKRSVLFIVVCLLAFACSAQHWKGGIFGGLGLAQMTLKQNQLNEQVFARQGSLFPTYSFGFHGYVTDSKNYPSRWLTTRKYIMIEASLCRCGGNVELFTELPNGDRTFDELRYIQYQGNYSVKFMFSLNRLLLFVGPNISSNFYSGVEVVKDEVVKSATNQFNFLSVGYEGGLGMELGRFLATVRLRGYFTPYGSETDLIPTEFGNIQAMFVIYYNYIDNNSERNRKSIHWD